MKDLIYVKAAKETCIEKLDTIKKIADNLLDLINEANEKSSDAKCSITNINIVITNIEEALKKIIRANEKKNYIESEAKKMIGLPEDDSCFDEKGQVTLTDTALEKITPELLFGNKAISVQQLETIVKNFDTWSTEQKRQIFTELLINIMSSYINLGEELYETGLEYTHETYEAWNIGYEVGEDLFYPDYDKYAREQEFNSIQAVRIAEILANNKEFPVTYENGTYDDRFGSGGYPTSLSAVDILNLIRSPEVELPEEFSHIPEYLWIETWDGKTGEETELARAMLLMAYSNNPEDNFAKYSEIVSNSCYHVWHSESAKDNNFSEVYYTINPLRNDIMNQAKAMEATNTMIYESFDEQGSIKSPDKLCKVFNEGYTKILKCIKEDMDIPLEVINDPIMKTTDKQKNEAWLDALKTLYPGKYDNVEIPSSTSNPELYNMYINTTGSSAMLLDIKEQLGDEKVIEFVKVYYKNLGHESDESYTNYILEELNRFEKRTNGTLNDVYTSFEEATEALNNLNYFGKNILDLGARKLDIPFEVKNMTNEAKAKALGISINELTFLDDYQIDGYIYLNNKSYKLRNQYKGLLDEIIIDKNAQKSARDIVNVLLPDSTFLAIITTISRFDRAMNLGLAYGLHNYGADIVNFFAYDGKVSGMELHQYYLNQYLTGDYSLYSDQNYNNSKTFLENATANNLLNENNNIYKFLNQEQRELYEQAIHSAQENKIEIKQYELLYNLGFINEEDYYKYKTLDNISDEDLKFYQKLGNAIDRKALGFTYTIGQGLGYMAVPMTLNAISVVTGNPVFAKIGLYSLGIASAGSKKEEMAQRGETNKLKIETYGLLNGLITMYVEKLGGFFGKGDDLIKLRWLDNIKGVSEGVKSLARMEINEITEEIIELFAGYGLDFLYDPSASPKSAGEVLNEVGQTVLHTAILTPMLSGYNNGMARRINSNIKTTYNSPFGSFELSPAEYSRFQKNNGELDFASLINYLEAKGRVNFKTEAEITNYFKQQHGDGYVSSIQNVDGNYVIETSNGDVLTYNVFGELLSHTKNTDTSTTIDDIRFIEIVNGVIEENSIMSTVSLLSNLNERQLNYLLSNRIITSNNEMARFVNNVINIYSEGTTAAQGKYKSFFQNFREHGIKHAIAVVAYAKGIASSIEGIDMNETLYAAMAHDFGMKGGLAYVDDKVYKKLSDAGLGETYTKGSIITIDDLEKHRTKFRSEEDIDQIVRSNHPLNSALTILTTNDLLPENVDKDVVALLAMTHSKSTSGISHFSEASEWLMAIDKLEVTVKQYNINNGLLGTPNEVVFNGNSLRSLVNDSNEFIRLQNEALAIRDADAMAPVVMTDDGGTLMQDGSYTIIQNNNPRVSFDDPVITDTSKEIAGILDLVYSKDGTPMTVIDENGRTVQKQITNSYSKSVHAGELNTYFESTYDKNGYSATAYLRDANQYPASSWRSIQERIDEVNTYTNVNGRVFEIVLPLEAKDTELARFYSSMISIYMNVNSEKVKNSAESEVIKNKQYDFYNNIRIVYR